MSLSRTIAGASKKPPLYYLFNPTALLHIYPTGNWDVSAAACDAFLPGVRILGGGFPFPFAFDASTSFVIWSFSTSFRVRHTPRLGRCGSPVSPPVVTVVTRRGGGGGKLLWRRDILDGEGHISGRWRWMEGLVAWRGLVSLAAAFNDPPNRLFGMLKSVIVLS